jgi:hypothetical protein
MIYVSGKSILQFLTTHYEFVQSIFNEGKPDFALESDTFHNLINEYNTSSESKLSIQRLIELKFVIQRPTGEYKVNPYYTDFLQFIFKNFILDLPETLQNRYQTVFNLFTHLQAEPHKEQVGLLIQEIVKEIDNFLMDIESETIKLLEDTESLKVNAENNADFSIRIQKASFWIDKYIIPLNAVLDSTHPNSIVNTIIQIQRYTNEKRFYEDDYVLRKEFEKLYACSVNARTGLDRHLSKLTRELMPLLERIKSDSIILSGFYHFVENIDYPENYIIPLPDLLRRSKQTIISKSFDADATFYIDQFSYLPQEVLYEEDNQEIEWLPDTEYFKEQLLKQKVIDNFYQWCFDEIKKHTDNITISKYFTVSNLILEEDLEAEYIDETRFQIQLTDAILKMPKVKLYAKLSDRT